MSGSRLVITPVTLFTTLTIYLFHRALSGSRWSWVWSGMALGVTLWTATGALRVDPHPAWDRSYTRIAFNACPNGRRQVFVADLRELLAAD